MYLTIGLFVVFLIFFVLFLFFYQISSCSFKEHDCRKYSRISYILFFLAFLFFLVSAERFLLFLEGRGIDLLQIFGMH